MVVYWGGATFAVNDDAVFFDEMPDYFDANVVKIEFGLGFDEIFEADFAVWFDDGEIFFELERDIVIVHHAYGYHCT